MSEVSRKLELFRRKDLRTLSRLISAAENQESDLLPILSELFSQTGHSRVIGITGPPGAGKSTLSNYFVRFAREQSQSAAVVAVDPVSPFTGGALLGDRIRLVDHFNDPQVFIRSLSTRGKLGGLSLATREVVHLVTAFGFNQVFVETVGVGQSEVEIRNLADLTLVVLVPEWGDSIQTLKAGLLEIGDLFVVNKSDREGADRLTHELKTMLQIAHRDSTPVLTSTTQDEKSVRALFAAVQSLWEENQTIIAQRRSEASRTAMKELLEAYLLREAKEYREKDPTPDANPYQGFINFQKKHPQGSLFRK
jgi:LAO/AO transport system kinase